MFWVFLAVIAFLCYRAFRNFRRRIVRDRAIKRYVEEAIVVHKEPRKPSLEQDWAYVVYDTLDKFLEEERGVYHLEEADANTQIVIAQISARLLVPVALELELSMNKLIMATIKLQYGYGWDKPFDESGLTPAKLLAMQSSKMILDYNNASLVDKDYSLRACFSIVMEKNDGHFFEWILPSRSLLNTTYLSILSVFPDAEFTAQDRARLALMKNISEMMGNDART